MTLTRFGIWITSNLRIAVLFILALFAPAAIADTTLRVDGDSGLTVAEGATGLDWDHAYKYLQDAITAASSATQQNPHQIWVKGDSDGVIYYPDEGNGLLAGTRTLAFQLYEFVSVYGGFNGPGDDELSDRNFVANVTILSGDLAGNDGANFSNYGDNSYHVVFSDGVDDTALIDGFTVRGGSAIGAPLGAGGGMLLEASFPRVLNCRVIDNQAQFLGGGIMLKNSPTTASSEIRGCEVARNRTTELASTERGGGIFVDESANIIDCLIEDNVAGSTSMGGGIVAGTGDTKIINCVIRENTAAGAGGVTVSGSSSTTLLMVNTLVVDNDATLGSAGGLNLGGQASVLLANCTIANNASATTGGGIYAATGNADLRNCIVWGNTATTGASQIGVNNVTVDIEHSDVQGGWSGTGNINADPNFDTTYHLQCDSPAINAGDNGDVPCDEFDVNGDALNCSSTPAQPTPDLDLLQRIAGNPATVDMGAFEKPYTAAECPGEVIGGTPVDIDDLLAVISAWGSCTVCTYDISPQPCGDGTIDINDLLVVIGNWCCPLPAPCPMSLNDAEDCMDAASLEYQPYSPEWIDVVEKCAEAFED